MMLLWLPFWICGGKAFFKARLSKMVQLEPQTLPYNTDVLDFLRSEHEHGRDIVLATAADRIIAERIAQHIGLFSAVLASDKNINLSGQRKLEAIQKYADARNFEYIGNASVDLPIWNKALIAHVVNPNRRFLQKVRKIAETGRVFVVTNRQWINILKAIRPHQWVKNLLLFIPILLSHKLNDYDHLLSASIAFVTFCLVSSSSYLVNDILDIHADRQHNSKASRPFAAGVLSIQGGILTSLCFVVIAFTISFYWLPPHFIAMLALYILLANLYSLFFKRIVVLDVLVLAGLYTHRLLAGAVATEGFVSAWLLGFSVFFFLSLAFVKRYTELLVLLSDNKTVMQGRGYSIIDIPMIQIFGAASGYLSVLVLALYITSNEVTALYKHPEILWLLGPCFLYWITRIWLLASRNEMHDDPIVFTFTDKASYLLGALIVTILVAAAM